MKIGLFFGSFNPIHLGHLIIANTMLENTDLEQVWFVVSPQNPLKKSNTLLHEFDRLYMVERAIADNFNMKACDVEFQMPRPSYTIDTLTYLQEKFPYHHFSLIIGEDNLLSFPKWKNYQKILELFALYVYRRPGCEGKEVLRHESINFVEAPLLGISATFIRTQLKENRSVKYLVPEEIIGYIKSKGFYS